MDNPNTCLVVDNVAQVYLKLKGRSTTQILTFTVTIHANQQYIYPPLACLKISGFMQELFEGHHIFCFFYAAVTLEFYKDFIVYKDYKRLHNLYRILL